MSDNKFSQLKKNNDNIIETITKDNVWKDPEKIFNEKKPIDDLIESEEINNDHDTINLSQKEPEKIINEEELKINRLYKIRNIIKEQKLEDEITYDNIYNIYNLLFNSDK